MADKPRTVQEMVNQVSNHALIASGNGTLEVNGHRAAEIVKKNIPVAKEAYKQLRHDVQAMFQRSQTQTADDSATKMILLCVLTALAGGLSNVTGDDSYVQQLGGLNPGG